MTINHKILLLLPGWLLLANLQASYGQPPVTLEMGTVINAAGAPVSDGLMVYGAESLKKNVSYNDVKGSPYINDSFRVSLLFDEGNNPIGMVRSRINFYNFNLHYIDKAGKEMVVTPELVKRVQYLDAIDNGNVLEEYSADVHYINKKMNKLVYAQVMNQGETRLVKFINKNLGTYDSLMGQFKRYMFVTREDYYIQKQNTVEPLRKLNRERIVAFTRHENELDAKAAKDHLDFKKEEDVVALLNYLNEQVASKN